MFPSGDSLKGLRARQSLARLPSVLCHPRDGDEVAPPRRERSGRGHFAGVRRPQLVEEQMRTVPAAGRMLAWL